jgi:hypothetical protein
MMRRIMFAIAIAMFLGFTADARAAFIDLTTAGANNILDNHSGAIGGQFIVQQVPDQSTGTGVIDAFVRVQAQGNNDTEQGYNTSIPTNQGNSPLDTKFGSFTHAISLADIPVVTISGVAYRQFLLDINQTTANPTLSLNQIQIFQANTDMLHTGLSAATVSANAVISFAGATEVFRLNNATINSSSHEIKLDYSLNAGSGSGDMFLYVRDSSFTGPTNNVILYSHFGTPPGGSGTNDGIEEWAVLRGSSTNPVPAPPSVLMLGIGMACVGLSQIRRTLRNRATAA